MILQLRPYRPQIGKQRPSDRLAQVGGACGSAGAVPRTDRALDHLHVTIAPLLDPFVQVDEALAQLRVLCVTAVEVDEDLLDLRRWFHRCGRVGGEQRWRDRIPFTREIVEERVPQRRRAVPAFQRRASAAAVGKTVNRLLGFDAKQEFDLTELIGLEAAGRIEPLTETEEFE